MKRTAIALILFLAQLEGSAQSVFQGIQYSLPEGFRIGDEKERLYLEWKSGKQYAQFFIYPLQPSGETATAAFNRYWDFFARNAGQGVNGPETTETDSLDGWTYHFGAARGSYKGQPFVITLSSRTGMGHSYFTGAVFTEKQHVQVAQDFMNSVSPTRDMLAKIAGGSGGSSTIPAPLTTLRTEFEDGWTSSWQYHYVEVSNGDIRGRIFPVDDSLDQSGRQPDARFEDKYWRYAVDRFFLTRNVTTRNLSMGVPDSYDVYEAEVRDRQTGQEGYLAMRVICNSGKCQPVLAWAPDKASLHKSVFAAYQSFEQVLPYNHFVPEKGNLLGTWAAFTSSSMGSYSMAGGFQGGKGNLQTTEEFIFFPDGRYESRESVKQSSGFRSARNYTGQYSLQPSGLSLTNREKNDPGVFECWMEAVKGGLCLRLVNKTFSGQQYTLFKIQ